MLSRTAANVAKERPLDSQALPDIKSYRLSPLFSPAVKHLCVAWLCLYGSARIGRTRSRQRSVGFVASTETQQNQCGVESAVAIGITCRSLITALRVVWHAIRSHALNGARGCRAIRRAVSRTFICSAKAEQRCMRRRTLNYRHRDVRGRPVSRPALEPLGRWSRKQ